MNLRELCRMSELPTAVLTTYNIDPLFFERVVLTDLIQGGATRIIILADADQALPAVSLVQGQLLLLGKRYRLIPIRGKGSFHPKVCIRLGPASAAVACGSHNLTRAGWLGCRKSDNAGGNREATLAWHVHPNTHAASELKRAIDALVELPASASDRDEIRHLLTVGWLSESADVAPEPWSWVVSGKERTLAAILEERWRGRRFERMRVICGSTDQQGAMLRWAAEKFGISKATVEVDLECCAFDPTLLPDLPVELRLLSYDGKPRTHLKAVVFESPSGCAAVVGSANCSGAAWLRPSSHAGNIESAVIFDNCNPGEFAHLFRAGVGDSKPWKEVGLSPSLRTETETIVPVGHRLHQLQLHRASGELIAVADFEVSPMTRAFAVVQSSRVPLAPTSAPRVFRGPMPDLVEGPETLFGHVELESGESIETTNAIWVDDVDRLSEVAGRHHRFDSVRRLSSLGVSADYRRLLEDLQVLSQALLSKPDEFPDGSAKPVREDKKENAEPPKPVTAADIIRTLDQLSSPGAVAASGSAFSGSISLTGILRLLFTEGAEAVDIDPTAAEHQRSNEEKESEQNPQQNGPTQYSENEDSGPTEAQRRRLAEQLKQFLDRLADHAFAAKCSARQLQQAAAFPLAVAKFASRGPWVQEAEFSVFADTIQRTCELLFFRNHLERNAKTGENQKRIPLLEEIRNRYVSEGRGESFDQIIGDGTLWLVLMGSLTLLSGDADRLFARNLILRDIARYPALSSNVVPEQIASLARRIQSESDADPLARAKRVVQAFEALEAFVGPTFEDLKQQPSTEATAGDWLWRPGMGFGQIIELGEAGKAKVHVRKKAETLNSVVLSYYLNLRLLADTDAEFRPLFDACSIA